MRNEIVMDYLIRNIGIRISQLRKDHGFTQEKLAEKLDITTKHVSAVERGVSSLSLEKIIEASKLFDCSLDYLVLGTNNSSNTTLLPPSILSVLSPNDEYEKAILLEYLNFYSKFRK